MDKMDFTGEIKLADTGDNIGTVSGYASVFNLLDRGGDIVLPGAFKASIAEWKRKNQAVPMLWQHSSDAPIGIWDDLVEDDRGLSVKGSLIMDVPQAVAARALIKGRALSGLSIGYVTKDAEIDRGTGARKIKKVDLWEVSLVTFPMLPEAQISGVKNLAEFNPRLLEQAFREVGLSNSDAKAATAVARKHLLRDGDLTSDDQTRDGVRDLLCNLRKAASRLR
jgi:HK97 family phage prohead protease